MKLSAEQSVILDRIANLKRAYDEWSQNLDREVAQAREEHKNPIRDAVREAVEAGIPVRQIHQKGLGYAQVNSMEKFLEAKTERLGERLTRLIQPVTVSQTTAQAEPAMERQAPAIKITEISDKEWRAVDRDGDEWVMYWIADGGMRLISDETTLDLAGEEVREAVKNHKPNTFLTYADYKAWLEEE